MLPETGRTVPEDTLPKMSTATSSDPTGDAGSLAHETRTTSLAGPNAFAPIDRVVDVPLTVTLRFGQRQMTLRELLELNTGSLVELDQQVEEPVHLMLGDRVIARGEVVIVDGNYGMRVLEVVDHPAQRWAVLGSA